MPRTRRFRAADLRGIILAIFDRFGDDLDVYVCFGERLAVLADHLDGIAGDMEIPADLDSMVRIMTIVAMAAFTEAPIGYPSESTRNVDAPTWRMRTEFSLECAIFFAQGCGYKVNASDLSNDHIARVLLVPDAWKELTQLFREALIVAKFDPTPQAASTYSPSHSAHETNDVGRYLSAEGWANLCSETDQRHWSDSEVVMLVDQHLRPDLNPSAVHYSETVSGEEWVILYKWLCGRDEEV
jgi:hypothetical protein